jgi:glucokinase
VYVTIGSGISGAVILDGRLYRGAEGAHPEIGHHVIDPSGPPCFCGAHGCWESLASGRAMDAWVRTQGGIDGPDAASLDAHAICSAAERGDLLAQQAVAREATYLGLGLANLITLFVPEVIALGGGLMGSHHLFRDGIRQTIGACCGLVPREKVRLEWAALGADAGLVGAACVWLHHHGGL